MEEPFEESDVVITDCGVDSTEALATGDPEVTATATVSNDNDSTAEVSVSFFANESELDTVTDTVSGGSSLDIELDIAFEEAGEVDVGVELDSASEA